MSNTRKLKETRMPRKIDLPSGAWVEIREDLKARDRFEVQSVAMLEVGEGRNKAALYEMQNDMRNALLGRIITSWSYGVPVPSANSFAAADVIIGEAMDLDDYAVLADEVEPLMDKIQGRKAPDPKKQ
jgi:hypothetical protein